MFSIIHCTQDKNQALPDAHYSDSAYKNGAVDVYGGSVRTPLKYLYSDRLLLADYG